MIVEPIGIITLALGIIGLFLPVSFIVYIFVASTLMGAAAAFILEFLGGTTIQPAHLLLAFLVFRVASQRDIVNDALRSLEIGRAGFWLLVTAAYSSVSAYVMPRLFHGETLVFTVRQIGINYGIPLEPTTANLTQAIYFVGNFICFVVLYGFASSRSGRSSLAKAAVACIVLNLIFVVLDLGTYWTGTTEILSIVRNSTYSLLNEVELAGFKRIVGSFVEPSSFSYWTLGYFAFASTLWLRGVATRFTLPLSLLTLTSLLFSTSTTGYAGLGLFLMVRLAETGFRFAMHKATTQMSHFLVGAPLVVVLTVLAIAVQTDASIYYYNLLDQMVLSKLSTESGLERTSWNAHAIQNFIDTFGFGVGTGSARTSSFPIAVLSNLGIIGSITYALFLLSIWRGGEPHGETDFEAAITPAARSACLAWLIAASVSGALIDLGLPFFAFAALACARPAPPRLKDVVYAPTVETNSQNRSTWRPMIS